VTRRRVAVTGVGGFTAAGTGPTFWRSLLNGRSALQPVDGPDAGSYDIPAAGRIRDFEPTSHMDKRIVIQTDRHTQLGLAATKAALEDAEIDLGAVDPTRVGVVLSNNLGGSIFGEQQLVNLHTRGGPHVSAYMAIAWFYAATIGQISIRYGFRGYAKTHIAERAGGHVAIADGMRAVQRGELDVCIAGGCEAPISPYAVLGYCDSGLLSPSGRYQPFGRDRDGLVLGEGAGIVLLEEWEHATGRGARIYAELLGFGHTCDGVDFRASADDGVQYARAVRLALADASLNLPDVGLAVVDASGSRQADLREARALRLAFGKHTDGVLVACPKAIFGHSFGAAGAIDTAIACLSLYGRVVPPVREAFDIDPECALPVVTGRSVFLDSPVAVILGTGRGGINAALVAKAV
jgi:3-oxoacyl-(acyl-carrier-protein) synthase